MNLTLLFPVHELLTRVCALFFLSFCLCCHLVSLFIFSHDFGSSYSVGYWQGVKGITLSSERIIVQLWSPSSPDRELVWVASCCLFTGPASLQSLSGVLCRASNALLVNGRNVSVISFHLIRILCIQWGNWDPEKRKFIHEEACQHHNILASKTPHRTTTSLTQFHQNACPIFSLSIIFFWIPNFLVFIKKIKKSSKMMRTSVGMQFMGPTFFSPSHCLFSLKKQNFLLFLSIFFSFPMSQEHWASLWLAC